MSYAVAMLFMAVYSLAMETLLACFIVDEQNQKGKGSKAPLYAPQELADLIDHDWCPIRYFIRFLWYDMMRFIEYLINH